MLKPSLLVFLGSGVSRPSGLPGVRELTHAILTEPLVLHTDQNYYPRKSGISALPGQENDAAHVQYFLRLLKAYADRYYSVRRGQESHYEDIYYLARQIKDDTLGAIDNPAVDGFIREVRAQAEPLIEMVQGVLQQNRYHVLAERACRLIECVVSSFLRTPAKIVGFDLLGEVAAATSIAQLDIVTLNHDLIVETFLRDQGHVVLDGFATASGDVRRFDSRLLDGTSRIRLLKPHGSVDWHRYRNQSSEDFIAIPTNGAPDYAKDSGGILLDRLEGPLFLAGTINKILDYGSGIFAEQFFRFHQLLKQHSRVLISGYGFSDRGINARLWDWLFEDSARKIVILHEQPDDLFMNARGSFRHAYQNLKSSGRLVIVERWMMDADLAQDLAGPLS